MGLTSFVFEEVIVPIVKGALEDYTKDMLKGVISEAVIAANPSVMGQAVRKALREFLEIFQDELESCACSAQEIRRNYKTPVSQFIKDSQVKILLGSPFADKSISSERLRNIWSQKRFTELPDEFSWQDVASRYRRKVKAIIKTTPELRAVLDSDNIAEVARIIKNRFGLLPGFNLEKYRESIKDCYGYLKLNVLDSTDHQYRLSLWKMFIPQAVREALPPSRYELPKSNQQALESTTQAKIGSFSAAAEQDYEKYFQQPVYPVMQLLLDDKYQRVVVLGDPGSGKSTLLQWLTLQWAENPTEQLPLLVELREYTRDRSHPSSFLDFFHKGTRTIYNLNQLELDRQLKSGSALVMFDGLDEIASSDARQSIITEIINFSNEYEKVKIIVTSRFVGYNAEYLRAAKFRHLTLQDLDDSRIEKFIDKWYELALGFDIDRDKIASRLKNDIASFSSISELARNPLLLTMMAILNRREGLPRDRPGLYEQASRVLLYNWDVDYKRLQIPAEALGRQEKQAMLRRVAYDMQHSEQGVEDNIVHRENLLDLTSQFLRELGFEQTYQKAQSLLDQLRERNFILCHWGNDYYGFVHRTFLEYFCAWDIVDRFQKQRTLTEEALKSSVFGEHWEDDSWREILCLIVGMLGERDANAMLSFLIKQKDETNSPANLILAAQCLSEVRAKVKVKQIADELLRLLKKNAENDLSPSNAFAVINEIAQIGKTQQATLDWLVSRVSSSDELFVRLASVQVVSKFWKDDPMTLSWLKSTVESDQDFRIRLTAVYEISDRWNTDSGTLSWLKTIAQSDKDSSIRGEALKEVARNWPTHPSILPWIETIAFNDSEIALAVSQAIFQGWESDIDEIPWFSTFCDSVPSPTDKLNIRRAYLLRKNHTL